MSNYVIVTPARNEGKYIGATIDRVVAQTLKPLLWVIVDDGSTDETASIIKRYASEHAFIRYHFRAKPPGQAYFASNVHAIMSGYELAKHLDFEFVAVLDADITLPEDYYELILGAFAQDDKLGIASGIYENVIDGKLYAVLSDRRSTPKAIMVFRREVFEVIEGFLPLPYGGEDTAACIMARMRGWKTWSFPDIKTIHHRPSGTGNSRGLLRARYVQGLHEYGLGSHPVFVVGKTFKRMLKEPPLLMGGMMRLLGYIHGIVKRDVRLMPEEAVRFYRNEQVGRMFRLNRVPTHLKPCAQDHQSIDDVSGRVNNCGVP